MLITVGLLLALAYVGFIVWDLSRHEVRHLPKWAWGLIAVAVSPPLGLIVYFVVGRVPREEEPGPSPPAPAADARAVAGAPQPESLASSAAEAHARSRARLGESLPGPREDRPAPRPDDDRPPVVRTTGLRKVYGDTVALDGVDVEVPAGSVYGLIGPNGAGKTTLFSILAGLRQATDGAFEWSVDRRAVAVLPDTPLFEPWLTAREVVDLSRNLVDPGIAPARVGEALDRVGLGEAAGRRVGGFSRGMLQRLGLAACLVTDPEVLVLDEPSSALDPTGRREVLDLIGEFAHTRTVVLSTHILADVQQVCDTVGVIDRGRLRFQGPLPALLARTSTAYHVHVRPPADAVVAALRAAPWVTSVEERAPGRIHLVVSDSDEAEAQIPGVLAGTGARLVSANPATDLETAFLEVIA